MSVTVFSLESKVAIVTGASQGIGRAIAVAFAEAGADVVVCSRGLHSKLEPVVQEIQELGRHCLGVQADVTQEAAVDTVVQKAVGEFGTIDVLVNNVGTIIRLPIVEHNEKDWDHVIDTNLKSCYLCSQAASRVMIDQKRGNIINIASIYGIKAPPGRGSYVVSKAGVIMLTRVLAVELAAYNIRVNAIAPGWVKNEMTRPLWDQPEVMKQIEAGIPLGRWAEVNDIAKVALFLASDISSYITGHTIVADGGVVVS